MKSFFWMMCKNRRTSWIACGNWLADHPDKKETDLPKKPTVEEIKAGTDDKQNTIFHESLHTDNAGGKVECGWNKEGFDEKARTLTKIKKAHADHWDRLVKLETDFLKILQAEENVAAEQANKRQRVSELDAVVVNECSEDEDDFAPVVREQV